MKKIMMSCLMLIIANTAFATKVGEVGSFENGSTLACKADMDVLVNGQIEYKLVNFDVVYLSGRPGGVHAMILGKDIKDTNGYKFSGSCSLKHCALTLDLSGGVISSIASGKISKENDDQFVLQAMNNSNNEFITFSCKNIPK